MLCWMLNQWQLMREKKRNSSSILMASPHRKCRILHETSLLLSIYSTPEHVLHWILWAWFLTTTCTKPGNIRNHRQVHGHSTSSSFAWNHTFFISPFLFRNQGRVPKRQATLVQEHCARISALTLCCLLVLESKRRCCSRWVSNQPGAQKRKHQVIHQRTIISPAAIPSGLLSLIRLVVGWVV
jgi:hypothetical protein